MKRIGIILATAAAVIGSLTLASPASAAIIKHNCGSGAQMCVYYNSQAQGYNAEYGNSSWVYSFNPAYNGGDTYQFKAGGQGSAGAGQTVWNNAGGAGNFSTYQNFAVFSNHGYSGSADTVPYGYRISLSTTHNNDTSMRWI